jgi:hypothetical protein
MRSTAPSWRASRTRPSPLLAKDYPRTSGATTIVHHARSAAAGLLEVAEQHDTRVIVVGSSPTGAFGRVAVGSVSSWLVHGSPVPVALPPRGYRCRPAARVTRVTAAYGGAGGADDLVVAAGAVAARVGAALRIASFAVRAHPPYTSGVGTGPEQDSSTSGPRR